MVLCDWCKQETDKPALMADILIALKPGAVPGRYHYCACHDCFKRMSGNPLVAGMIGKLFSLGLIGGKNEVSELRQGNVRG
jgi:hypothetical protein